MVTSITEAVRRGESTTYFTVSPAKSYSFVMVTLLEEAGVGACALTSLGFDSVCRGRKEHTEQSVSFESIPWLQLHSFHLRYTCMLCNKFKASGFMNHEADSIKMLTVTCN